MRRLIGWMGEHETCHTQPVTWEVAKCKIRGGIFQPLVEGLGFDEVGR